MTNFSSEYPQNVDFLNAIRNPQDCFQDEELRQCQAMKNKRGQPISWSGRFAIVFKLESAQTSWGIRCFTETPEDNAKTRYDTISQYLHNNTVKYIVKFEFIESGILVNNSWYPIVKMEWVEGETLDKYLDEYLKQNQFVQVTLINLLNGIEEMQKELKAAKIAHGDLQHDNILVTPDQRLKLVDYDEMYVPGLEEYAPKREKGHPNYQNPKRAYEDWGEDIDNFSFKVILLSINALFHQPSLWQQFHRENDNLIFKKEDFLNPDTSAIFQSLLHHPKVRRLTEELQQMCPSQELVSPETEDDFAESEYEIVPESPEISFEIWQNPPVIKPPPKTLKSEILKIIKNKFFIIFTLIICGLLIAVVLSILF